MYEELKRDSDIVILGEDIGNRGGVFLATDGFIDEFGAQRIIDTPLAESSIAGIALGAALNGIRPIAEIQFADFIWPAINQIVGEASKVHYGTFGQLNAPIVIRTPFGGGVKGGLYHSQSIEVIFSHTPGLKVIIPSTPYDAKGLLKSAIRDDNPVIFLEHKHTYRSVKGEVPNTDYTIPIGKADVKLKGDDLTIISYGLMVRYCIEVAISMKTQGINLEVIDLRTLRPLDVTTLVESVKKTGKCLVVQEDTQAYGIGAEVASCIADLAFEYLDGPVKRLSGPEVPPMPFSPSLEDEFMLNEEKIETAVKALLDY